MLYFISKYNKNFGRQDLKRTSLVPLGTIS